MRRHNCHTWVHVSITRNLSDVSTSTGYAVVTVTGSHTPDGVEPIYVDLLKLKHDENTMELATTIMRQGKTPRSTTGELKLAITKNPLNDR